MTESPELPEYTHEEISRHCTESDLWIVIDSIVYNMSRFMRVHPGGSVVLLSPTVAGKDATDIFYGLHRQEVLDRSASAKLVIGRVKGGSQRIKRKVAGELSQVPYAEPMWLSGAFQSPYFTDAHKRLQKAMRLWVDKVFLPVAMAREVDGKYITHTPDVIRESCKMGMMAMRLGPGKHLEGYELMGGAITPQEFDYFAEMIVTQELMRTGQRGMGDGFLTGGVIGLPPVINFGKPALKARIVKQVLDGEKLMALCISEPFVGSDVAGMKTTATKSADGTYYTINGIKKWITNGNFADYFSIACKTYKGLTMFFVERGEGVTSSQIKTSYSTTAGTSLIEFKNVRVPAENMLGKENQGLIVVLSNFNHERLVMCAGSVAISRLVIEECTKWANQRRVFGQSLLSQPVIRQKLGSMIAQVEALQAWLEAITHQMNKMNYKQQSEHLGGPIALLKYQCTRSEHFIADHAVQIFGGRGLTQTGMGRVIELFQRSYKFNAVLGGSEEIMADLGVKRALRAFPENARL